MVFSDLTQRLIDNCSLDHFAAQIKVFFTGILGNLLKLFLLVCNKHSHCRVFIWLANLYIGTYFLLKSIRAGSLDVFKKVLLK